MATTNRELARATTPFGYFEPFFGRRWMKEFDRFFEPEFAWMPEMEVFEKNNRLTVRLDVPGLKPEDVKVHVTEGLLAVEGERRHHTEEEKNNYYRRERTYGRFYRTVPLPEGVKAKEVEATFTAGVLEVTVPLPVARAETPHKVEVRVPDEKVTVAAA